MRLFQSTAATIRFSAIAAEIRDTFASILDTVADVSTRVVMPLYAMPAVQPVNQFVPDHTCPGGGLSHLRPTASWCDHRLSKRTTRRG